MSVGCIWTAAMAAFLRQMGAAAQQSSEVSESSFCPSKSGALLMNSPAATFLDSESKDLAK